jgi:thioredoxin-related protein
MLKSRFRFILIIAICLLGATDDVFTQISTVNWMTWEKAMEARAKLPKKMLIYVITDSCVNCDKMDRISFSNPDNIDYINGNFYPIIVNAQSRDTIHYAGSKFFWTQTDDRNSSRGVHTFAHALLDGQLVYPTLVYLDENMSRILISPVSKFGFYQSFQKELRYVGEGIYRTKTYDQYIKGQ